MGKANYFQSFKKNADDFICSLLPGISPPQVQYSPGNYIIIALIFLGNFRQLNHNTQANDPLAFQRESISLFRELHVMSQIRQPCNCQEIIVLLSNKVFEDYYKLQ